MFNFDPALLYFMVSLGLACFFFGLVVGAALEERYQRRRGAT